jgi:lysozyme
MATQKKATDKKPAPKPRVDSDETIRKFALDTGVNYEDFSDIVYPDSVGHPTIGFGFNLDEPATVQYLISKGYNVNALRNKQAKISRPESEKILTELFTNAYDNARTFVSNFDALPEQARYILADMTYNMGPSRLANFKQMKAAFENNNFNEAAKQLKNSKYYNQVGRRSKTHYNTLLDLTAKSEPKLDFVPNFPVLQYTNDGQKWVNYPAQIGPTQGNATYLDKEPSEESILQPKIDALGWDGFNYVKKENLPEKAEPTMWQGFKQTVKDAFFADGGWIDMYDDGGDVPSNNKYNSIPTGIIKPPTIFSTTGVSHYAPEEQTIYLNPEDEYYDPSVYQHEMFHHWQNLNDQLRRPEEYKGPLVKPSIVANENAQMDYYNRRNIESDEAFKQFYKENPTFKLVNPWINYYKEINPSLYENPKYAEGEAEDYQNYIISGGTPAFMAKGGMIKRADSSYSRRGLWDNIRANRGSGRKPTAEMLRQERKIKKHKDGSIVEGGEYLPIDPRTGMPVKTLKEVEVVADRPDTYNNYITNKYKNAGLAATMFGMPLDYVLGYPQAAMTKAFTGKYQTPSEAMDIENPYLAAGVDMVIDPSNLVGLGILTKEQALAKLAASKESGILSNAYKLNPKALKEAQETMLVRARPVGQNPYINMAESLRAKEAAGEPLKWYQKNLLNPQTNPDIIAREKYFGQWFADNPSDLDFYINPETRNFADDAQIEILKVRMPKSEAAKYNVKNFKDAKSLSNLHDTEYIRPKNMVQQAERYSVDDLSKLVEEYNQITKPHWLKGYKQVPKKEDGSWVTDSSIPRPTTPSFYDAGEDTTLSNYQMGTDKAPMYKTGGPTGGGGNGVQPFITSDPNLYKQRLQAYNDSVYTHNLGLANLKYAQSQLKQNVDKFNAQLPSAFGNIIGPSISIAPIHRFDVHSGGDKIRGIYPTEMAVQGTDRMRWTGQKDYFNLYNNPSYYRPMTPDELSQYTQLRADVPVYQRSSYFPYVERDIYNTGYIDLYDAPKQKVIFNKNAPQPQPPQPPEEPHGIEIIDPIKRRELNLTDLVLPTEEYDMQPIREEVPKGSSQPILTIVPNPKFNLGAGKRTKEAVVDELGNPRNVYYYGDKAISKEEYSKLWDERNKFAQGGPVMYNAGSTVWTKQDTPLWAAGTPTPTATQNFRNTGSLNTNRYRIGDVIPTDMEYKTPSAGTYDYNKDAQPYHTMRLHAPDTTIMARRGGHVNSPRVYGSPVNPSGMFQGPTSQRGITFGKGGLINMYANAGVVTDCPPGSIKDAQGNCIDVTGVGAAMTGVRQSFLNSQQQAANKQAQVQSDLQTSMRGYTTAPASTTAVSNTPKKIADFQTKKFEQDKQDIAQYGNVEIGRAIRAGQTVDNGTIRALTKEEGSDLSNEKEENKYQIADDRKARIAEANAMNAEIDANGYFGSALIGDPNWRKKMAISTQATGDRFRISDYPNTFDDYINPLAWFGGMASRLGQAPYQAEQTNSIMPYVTSIGEPLLVGAGERVIGDLLKGIPIGSKAIPAITPAITPKGQLGVTNLIESGYNQTKNTIRSFITQPQLEIAKIRYPKNSLQGAYVRQFQTHILPKSIKEATVPVYSLNLETDFTNSIHKIITDLQTGQNNVVNSLTKKLKELNTPEGYNRLLQQEKDLITQDFNPVDGVIVKGENGLIERNADGSFKLTYDPVIANQELEKAAQAQVDITYNALSKTLSHNEKILTEFNKKIKFLDSNSPTYKEDVAKLFEEVRLERYNKGNYNIPNFNAQAGPSRKLKVPNTISIGYGYGESAATIDHEINHLIAGNRVTSIDNALRNGLKIKYNLNPTEKGWESYFRTGSDNMEPSSFLAELRTLMLENGFIKNTYDKITPELMEKAYNYFKQNPSLRHLKGGTKINYFASDDRILHIIEPSKANFELLSSQMNKLPIIGGVGIVGAGLMNQTSNQNAVQKQANGGYVKNNNSNTWLDSYN